MKGTLSSVQEFVSRVANAEGYSLTAFDDPDPTTLLLIQPVDDLENTGPNERDVENLIRVLAASQKTYQLPVPLHFQIHRMMAPPASFGDNSDHPPIIYKIRVSTLE